jgi:multicomponent Na+:H+ antiporter subunit E
MPGRSPAAGSSAAISRFAPVTWVLLYLFWVVLSGKFSLFPLVVGLLTVFGFAWMQSGLKPLRNPDEPRLATAPVIRYLPWLVVQMLLSSFYVAKLILFRAKEVDPCMFRFKSDQPSVVHRVIFANSITLTPGTLTLDLENDTFCVHAISRRTAEGVLDGVMASRVAQLSGSQPSLENSVKNVEWMD